MPSNPIYWLAHWFVTDYLGRAWTNTDEKGMHLHHARSVLRDYAELDIKGCLLANRDGLIGNGFQPTLLAHIRQGEPPLIEQWFVYRREPPPVYLEATYEAWQRRVPQGEIDET